MSVASRTARNCLYTLHTYTHRNFIYLFIRIPLWQWLWLSLLPMLLCANWNGQMHKKFIYNTSCSNQYSWYCSKAATRHSITIKIGMRNRTRERKMARNTVEMCNGLVVNDNARSRSAFSMHKEKTFIAIEWTAKEERQKKKITTATSKRKSVKSQTSDMIANGVNWTDTEPFVGSAKHVEHSFWFAFLWVLPIIQFKMESLSLKFKVYPTLQFRYPSTVL